VSGTWRQHPYNKAQAETEASGLGGVSRPVGTTFAKWYSTCFNLVTCHYNACSGI